jgi:hypothetical protein
MPDLVDLFMSRMAGGLARRSQQPGADVWPAPVVNLQEANYLSHTSLLSALGHAYETVGASQDAIGKIAIAFGLPSRPAQLMYLFNERPADEADGLRRRWLAGQLLETISALRLGDPLCLSGSNRVVSDEDYEGAQVDVEWATEAGIPELRRTVAELIVLLSSYCECLYFALLAFGREHHGPYRRPNGGEDLVVVREYRDLHPPHWRFPEFLPFRELRLHTAYRGIAFQFDFVGRMDCDRPLAPNLSGLGIEIDGETRPATLATLQELRAVVRTALDAARNEIVAMAPRDLLLQWTRGQFWAIRPVLALAGKEASARPPEPLVDALLHGPLEAWLPQRMLELRDLPEAMRVAQLTRLLDPGDHRKGL